MAPYTFVLIFFFYARVISDHKFSEKLVSNLDGVFTTHLTMRINSLSKLEIHIFIPQYNFLNNEYSNVGIRVLDVGSADNCKGKAKIDTL